MPLRLLLPWIVALVCLSGSPAFAEPFALAVSGRLGDVRTERLTSPDAATSQGVVPGAAITGVLSIDFDVDLTVIGAPFFALLDFQIGDLSFTSRAQTITVNGAASRFGLIFLAPFGTGSPRFHIDEVFMDLVTSAPFTRSTFSSIDPHALQLEHWFGTLPLGGVNQLAFQATNLEIHAVPEPSTLLLAIVGLSMLPLSSAVRRRARPKDEGDNR